MSSFYLDQTFVISDNLAPVFFLLRVLQKYFLVLCFMSLFNLRMQTYLSKCRVSAGQFNIFGQIVCASRSYLQNRPLWNVNSVERGRNARRLKRQRVSNTSSLLHFGFTNIFYVLKKVCLRDTISWRKKNCFLNLCHCVLQSYILGKLGETISLLPEQRNPFLYKKIWCVNNLLDGNCLHVQRYQQVWKNK